MRIRQGIPILYAGAILIGFLINARAGVIVCIGGAVICAALYTIFRPAVTAENSRRAARRRNRVR